MGGSSSHVKLLTSNFFRWFAGAVIGTAIVAVTSPLFVRSYVPLAADTARGVWTLPPHQVYRWRSEGYANTAIGPLGMPGKTSIPKPAESIHRMALWGDSQAEGVCVADHQKLFAQIESASGNRIQVFPLTRSGEDASHWTTQMQAVEQELAIDRHVILVVDLPDLLAAVDAPLPPPSETEIQRARSAIAAMLPAYIIQAARHLLTEDDEVTPRRLRFRIGPVHDNDAGALAAPPGRSDRSPTRPDWSAALNAITSATAKPVVLLYAPKAPQIVAGNVITQDLQDSMFNDMASAARRLAIPVIDVRAALRDSADRGSWPHGFHNGYIGSGHLNAVGYRVVANELVKSIADPIAGSEK